jgi:hypothetical protein
MSKAVKSIFGGTDRSAQRATQAQNEQSRGFIQQQEGRAQNFLTQGLGDASRMSAQGFGGAMDIIGQAAPEQINAMQQGNVAAQQYLLGGMPAFQNALMGMPVNYSQFQPTQIQFNPSVFSQRLPQGLQGQQPQPQQMTPEMMNLLSGIVR